MSSDRQHNESTADADLSVEDLPLQNIDGRSADQIKGGFQITKTVDKASTTLMQTSGSTKPTTTSAT